MWKWHAFICPKIEVLPVSEQYGSTRLYLVAGLLFLLITITSIIEPSSLIALLLLGVCVLGMWAFLRPHLVLLLIFAAAGLPSLLIPLPDHTMRLVEPALLLSIVLVILYRPFARLGISHALALLFTGLALISFINVPDVSTNLNALAADKRLYEILLSIVAFFCGTFLVNTIKNISTFLVALLLCNIPCYLIAFFQVLGLPLPAGLEFPGAHDPAQTQGRLWGPTSGAATFGLYLVNLFAVALACWLLGKRRRHRVIGFCMVLIIGLEIIGSGTRSAALGAALILIVSLVFTRRFRLLLIVAIGGMLGAALVFNSIVPLFLHEQASVSNRLFLWQYALQLIYEHPWIGIGLAQFHVYYEHLIVQPGNLLNPHGISVHQQYLELALEGGVIWLIVAVLFLLSIGYVCRNAWRRLEPSWRLLPFAVMLILLANAVIGFFDVPLDKAEGAICIFLLAGMALGCTKYAAPPQAASAEKHTTRLLEQPPGGANGDATPSTRKTVRTIAIQLLLWGLTAPVMFPVTALLTHYLGPEQYGDYSFTLPFLAIGALLSGTGMDPLLIRRLSRLHRERWSEPLSYAAGSRLLTTGLSAGAICLLALWLPLDAEVRTMLILGVFSLFFSFSFNGWRAIFTHGFRAEQRVTVLIVLESLNRLLTAFAVVMVVLLRLPLIWVYVLIIYSDLPCFIAQMWIARRRFSIHLRFSLARLRKYYLGSLSLTGYDALSLVTSQADILFLMWFTGPLQVGLYALAIRISDPLLAIAFTYVNGLYPLLCSTFEKGREDFARLFYEAMRIISLVLLPLSLFISMEASAIVQLVGGQDFGAAAILVQLLFWATAIIFYSQLAAQSCMAANMERIIPYVAGVGTAVNILGNLALIPLYQAIGAGIACLISELLSLVMFLVLLRRQIFVMRTCVVVARVFLGNMPMLIFLWWARQLSPLLTIPISIVLVIAGSFVMRTLTWQDVLLVRRFIFSGRVEHRQAVAPLDCSGPIMPVASAEQDVSDCPTLILPPRQG